MEFPEMLFFLAEFDLKYDNDICFSCTEFLCI